MQETESRHQAHGKTPREWEPACKLIWLYREQGLTHFRVREILKKEHEMNLTESTYYRVWALTLKLVGKEFNPKQLGTQFLIEKRALFREAKAKYQKTGEISALRAANEIHASMFDQAQELGLIPKGEEKLRVTGDVVLNLVDNLEAAKKWLEDKRMRERRIIEPS